MIVGDIFGYLTVTDLPNLSDDRGRKYVEVRCECGVVKVVQKSHLTQKKYPTRSCGCKQEYHGLTKSPEYATYSHILRKCLNPLDPAYKHYGGRGIGVCDRWKESFKNFLEDMGQKPTPAHSIDRIENDGDYCKSNCEWVTVDIQQTNKRNTVFVNINGTTNSVAHWSRESGTPASTLYNRIDVQGMSPIDAIYLDCDNVFLNKYPKQNG